MEAIRKVAERVEQSVMETVGSASKTELEPALVARLQMADDIRANAEKLLAAMQKHIPHDPRLTAAFVNASHPADVVASAMKSFADSADRWPESELREQARAVFRAGADVYKALCRSEKIFVENSAIHFIAPMKHFLTADTKKLEQERKELLVMRVDMDSARNRAAKHAECAPEAERATRAFERQKEIVDEEISGLERKLAIVCRAISTHADDVVAHLEKSLASARQLQAAVTRAATPHEVEKSAVDKDDNGVKVDCAAATAVVAARTNGSIASIQKTAKKVVEATSSESAV